MKAEWAWTSLSASAIFKKWVRSRGVFIPLPYRRPRICLLGDDSIILVVFVLLNILFVCVDAIPTTTAMIAQDTKECFFVFSLCSPVFGLLLQLLQRNNVHGRHWEIVPASKVNNVQNILTHGHVREHQKSRGNSSSCVFYIITYTHITLLLIIIKYRGGGSFFCSISPQFFAALFCFGPPAIYFCHLLFSANDVQQWFGGDRKQ